MAKLLIRGKDAQAHAQRELDAYALTRWGCVVLDLFEAFSAYVPLRDRWTRMDGWLTANRSDPRWPERHRKCAEVYVRCLGQGGLFDQCDRVLQRLEMAHRLLSDAALIQLESDYGTTMETQLHPFYTNVMIDAAPADLPAFLDAWAIAAGGHAKERGDIDVCPF